MSRSTAHLFALAAACGWLTTSAALATPLVSYHSKSPILEQLQVDQTTPTSFRLTISSASAVDAKVFSIDSPARIVVDLPSKDRARSKSLAFGKPTSLSGNQAENSLIRGVRMAAHEDKLRVVLDLTGNSVPPFAVEAKAGSLILNCGEGAKSAGLSTAHGVSPSDITQIAPTTGEQSAGADKHTIAKLSQTTESAARTLTTDIKVAPKAVSPQLGKPEVIGAQRLERKEGIESEQATLAHDPTPAQSTPTPAQDSTPSAPAVLKLSFESSADGTHSIRLALNHRPHFRLARKDEHSYVLRIDGCELGNENLALPFFPPQEFVGFTVIRATEIGSAVEVLVGIERGTRLSAIPEDAAILIRATP